MSEAQAWIYSIGSLLGGLGAIVLAGVGMLSLRGFKRWRQEQRELKRAEVAAECMVAISDFTDAIKHVANPSGLPGTGQQPDYAKKVMDGLALRLGQVRDYLVGAARAQAKAEAILPDGAASYFEEANEVLTKVRAAAHTWAGIYYPGMTGNVAAEAHQWWQQAFGDQVRDRLDDIKRRAKERLRPLAQFLE